ncbi:hypothetical protein [Ruegeria arenilitoris]|uniref:hypothetical protein n=1 Tax=Ruegeria arenilitoris TaxID=1173585 RepID=UPI00147CAFCE|nr:hypothetical protein [Ruegeria arenilitoris]
MLFPFLLILARRYKDRNARQLNGLVTIPNFLAQNPQSVAVKKDQGVQVWEGYLPPVSDCIIT